MSDNPPEPAQPSTKIFSAFDVITIIDATIVKCLRSQSAQDRDHMSIAKSVYDDLAAQGLIQHQEQSI